MILLEQIQVASPCHSNWEEMTGTEQVRFCQGCRKNVYNLSEMTREEAQALVTEMEGRLCVRFYTRADGTVLTQDCPVGLRAIRVTLAKKFSYAVALLLACGTSLLRGTSLAQAATSPRACKVAAAKHTVKRPAAPPAPRPTMGKVAAPQPSTLMGSMVVPQTLPPTMGVPLPVPPVPGK